MFIQVGVYKKGGTYTVSATTAKLCQEETNLYSHRIKSELLAIMIPYELVKGVDASIPQDWHKDLGEEFMKAYRDGEEPTSTPPIKEPLTIQQLRAGSKRTNYAYWPL